MPTFDTVIPFAPAEIDLEQWLYNMSDQEYQETAPQHRALGVYYDNGVRGMVNVEVLGHALMIQHYSEVTSRPDYLELVSPRSHTYLMHVLSIRVGVRWKMQITPTDDGKSRFACTVRTEMSPFLNLLAAATGVSWAIRRHTRIETHGFAANLQSKLPNRVNAGDWSSSTTAT